MQWALWFEASIYFCDWRLCHFSSLPTPRNCEWIVVIRIAVCIDRYILIHLVVFNVISVNFHCSTRSQVRGIPGARISSCLFCIPVQDCRRSWWLTFKPEGPILVNCHVEAASDNCASFLYCCRCVFVCDITAYAVFQEKQRFLTDVLHEVMLLDGLASSHPVSQEVQQATDIDRVFDWIAYKKVRLIKPLCLYI